MKIIQIMLLLLFLAAQSFANPASSVTFPVKQPDGTVLEVRQEGNEWFHVLKTSDGYILQKDERGFYAFMQKMLVNEVALMLSSFRILIKKRFMINC